MSALGSDVRLCLFYEFKLGTNVRETTKKICTAFGENVVNEQSVGECFNKFREERNSLKKVPNEQNSVSVKSVSVTSTPQSTPGQKSKRHKRRSHNAKAEKISETDSKPGAASDPCRGESSKSPDVSKPHGNTDNIPSTEKVNIKGEPHLLCATGDQTPQKSKGKSSSNVASRKQEKSEELPPTEKVTAKDEPALPSSSSGTTQESGGVVVTEEINIKTDSAEDIRSSSATFEEMKMKWLLENDNYEMDPFQSPVESRNVQHLGLLPKQLLGGAPLMTNLPIMDRIKELCQIVEKANQGQQQQPKVGRCRECAPKKNRKTKYFCKKCHKYLCLEHVQVLCNDCFE